MKSQTTRLLGLKFIILSIILFGLYSIDFWGLGLTKEVRTVPMMLLLVSLLHTAVITWPVVQSKSGSWRLAAAVFLVYYGVTTLMVAIEAVYLPDTLPLKLVIPMLVNGAITSTIFSILAVLVYGRMNMAEKPKADTPQPAMSWKQWIWKLTLIGFSWVALFIIFGAVIFLPLVNLIAPKAGGVYTNMDMPAWILPFQALRAVFWAVLTLPVIRIMNRDIPAFTKKSKWKTGLTVALLYSVLMSGNLLRSVSLSPGLRIAHLVEVFGENFIFGWIVVWLLSYPSKGRNFGNNFNKFTEGNKYLENIMRKT